MQQFSIKNETKLRNERIAKRFFFFFLVIEIGQFSPQTENKKEENIPLGALK